MKGSPFVIYILERKKLDKSNKSIDAVVTSAGFLWLHGSAVVRNSKSARRAGIWNESFIS